MGSLYGFVYVGTWVIAVKSGSYWLMVLWLAFSTLVLGIGAWYLSKRSVLGANDFLAAAFITVPVLTVCFVLLQHGIVGCAPPSLRAIVLYTWSMYVPMPLSCYLYWRLRTDQRLPPKTAGA